MSVNRTFCLTLSIQDETTDDDGNDALWRMPTGRRNWYARGYHDYRHG
jgi:hypothetical protein